MADIRLAAARRGMDANTRSVEIARLLRGLDPACVVSRYVKRTMTNASITMYSTQWCGYCHRLKKVLKSEGIAYDEVDIENDPAAAEFVGSVNNGNHVVPTVKFADGSTMTNPAAKEVKAKLAQLAG
jgi:mycoredoxin